MGKTREIPRETLPPAQEAQPGFTPESGAARVDGLQGTGASSGEDGRFDFGGDSEPEISAPGSFLCPRCNARVPTPHRYCGFCGHNLIGSLPAQTVGDPLVGAVVGGRYRLLAKIGAGGMGTVYKVEHVQMGKIMAMKLLHGDLSRDESMIRRFIREGRAVSRLGCINTVQVFDYGQSDGLVYLVMEFLRGRDLGHVLREFGPMSVERCVEIVHQICKALSEAHAKGVIHRDLKPENIFLCAPQGGHELVKVLDFGLAKLSEREELGAQTLGGSLIGTPYYMSPEQISGRDNVGPSSDIYGLGALIFKLVTGEPPFASKHPMGVLSAHLHDPVPLAAERLPEFAASLSRLDPILQIAMRKAPDQRFESAAALDRALHDCLEERPPEAALARSDDARGEIPPSHSTWFAPEVAAERQETISTRADWARYERGLRLRGLISASAFILALGAAGFGAWWGLVEGNLFVRDLEGEPNDRTLKATPMTLGLPMRGAIGLATDGKRADQDFFEIRHDGPPGHLIELDLSSVEGLDLVLEVYNMGSQRLAISNVGGVGEPEHLGNILWSGDPLFVLVREVWTEGIPARAAPDNPYTLSATAGPRLDRLVEREPNDLVKYAEPVRPGEARQGEVTDASDVDLYVLPPIPTEGVILQADLRGSQRQDLALALIDGGGNTLQRIDAGRAGAPERALIFLAPMGRQPLHLAVSASAKGSPVGHTKGSYSLIFSFEHVADALPFKVFVGQREVAP